MRSKFRVNDTIVTCDTIDVRCCNTTIEKGVRAKVADVDPDTGDLVIRPYGYFPDLDLLRNVVPLSASEAPSKIKREKRRTEISGCIAHSGIGLGICVIIAMLGIHYSSKPATAAATEQATAFTNNPTSRHAFFHDRVITPADLCSRHTAHDFGI